jgi:hypothetical protein
MGTVEPLARRTPGEFTGSWRILQRFACRKQCIDIDTVVDDLAHLAISS